MIINSIDELIGNTPLLRIDPSVHGLKTIDVYAKLELMNPWASVKDRVAKGLLAPVLSECVDKQKTIVEASSGNTGKALAALCNMHGLTFKSYTNRIKVAEQRMILQLMGADIEELPGLSDCPDPNDPNDPTKLCSDLASTQPEQYEYTDQYFNEKNIQTHYECTGKEIYTDLGEVDYFVGPLGTCGSTMGTGLYLKEHSTDLKIVGAVAEAGNWIPGGRNINELWEVGFYKREFYDAIISGNVQESLESMIELVTKSGLLMGPTAGLAYHALKKYLKPIDQHRAETCGHEDKAKAVFIACDRLEPYLTYIKKYRPEIFSTSTTSRKTVFSQTDHEISQGQTLTAETLHKRLNENPFLIDIRSAYAFKVGHIQGSINIRDELFAIMLEEGTAFPKERPIVVVCSVGDISLKFSSFLKDHGYDAYSLTGGLSQWKAQALPLHRAKRN